MNTRPEVEEKARQRNRGYEKRELTGSKTDGEKSTGRRFRGQIIVFGIH